MEEGRKGQEAGKGRKNVKQKIEGKRKIFCARLTEKGEGDKRREGEVFSLSIPSFIKNIDLQCIAEQ